MKDSQQIDTGSDEVVKVPEEPVDLMMVTYNRLNLTKQTIEGLQECLGGEPGKRLIIVDNGSTDGTVEYLKQRVEKHPGLVVHFNKENEGIARGRNRALSMSTAQWLCTVDNDVLMPAGWLQDAINIIKQNPSYGCIGVNFEKQQYPLIEKNGFIFQHKKRGNLGTACMVFPRTIHRLLGYFNYTDYSPFYGLEDSDFGMRMEVLGFNKGYIKEPGLHLGEGKEDVGEYRTFKTKEHDGHLLTFNRNCRLYHQAAKPLYVKYQPEDAT